MSPKNSAIQQREQGMEVDFQKKIVLAQVKKGVKLTTLLKTLLSSPTPSSTHYLVNQVLSCFENAISALKIPSHHLPILPTSPNQRSGEEDMGMNEQTQSKCGEELHHVWVTNDVSQVIPSFTMYDQEFAFDPFVWDVLPSSNNPSGGSL